MIRSLQAFFLSLILAITSQGMAVARGQNPDAGTDMVICTGYGMVVMTIGPDGKPVEKTQICPDALSIFADGVYSPAAPVVVRRVGAAVAAVYAVFSFVRVAMVPQARGPPLSV
jgi:hypothetical protein